METKACYQPGWDEGPVLTGGEPDGYQCELAGDHDGDHEWENQIDNEIVKWPVTWVQEN